MRKLYSLSVVSAVLLVGVCSCSRQESEQTYSSKHESFPGHQVRFKTPPNDYSAWLKEFGGNEPDVATEDGRKRLCCEQKRLRNSQLEFEKVLADLHSAYTNSSESAVHDILSRIDNVLKGYSRENSAVILGAVGNNPSIMNPSFELFVTPEFGTRVTERYAIIAGRLADLTWVKGGEAFTAAEIDNTIFKVLKGIMRFCEQRSFDEARKVAHDWFARYAQERCDSKSSNFYRSHMECERRYQMHFEVLVRQDPRLEKPLSHWYRRHLKCARNILGRDPMWSPEVIQDKDRK